MTSVHRTFSGPIRRTRRASAHNCRLTVSQIIRRRSPVRPPNLRELTYLGLICVGSATVGSAALLATRAITTTLALTLVFDATVVAGFMLTLGTVLRSD